MAVDGKITGLIEILPRSSTHKYVVHPFMVYLLTFYFVMPVISAILPYCNKQSPSTTFSAGLG